jgi:acyl-CoA thioester hydrolase
MYSFDFKVRVSYADTDQMGYSYYGNYAKYFEIGRVESLRSMGLSYKSFEESGIMMPVLELKCKYIKPVYYDDLLTIRTIIDQLPEARIYFKYEVYNEKQTLTTIGETTLVFVDMKTGKVDRCPQELTDKLTPYF